MILNSKKTLVLAAFMLISASSFSLQIIEQIWTDEEFHKRDKYGSTILHNAIQYYDEISLNRILNDKRLPNIINLQKDTGSTALHLAALNDYENGCRLLIQAGADKTIVDNGNLKALFYLANKDLEKELEALEPSNSFIRPAIYSWKKIIFGTISAVAGIGIASYLVKTYFDKNKQVKKEA